MFGRTAETPPLDQHVGGFEVADRAVEAEHDAAFDQDRPPGRGARRAPAPWATPITWAAIAGAATAPAAVVQRNWRRDMADDDGARSKRQEKRE
jgi:hypothetical protein